MEYLETFFDEVRIYTVESIYWDRDNNFGLSSGVVFFFFFFFVALNIEH